MDNRLSLKRPYSGVINVEELGCWKDTDFDRAIQSLEGTHALLKEFYMSHTNAYDKCLGATLSFGYTVFALQNGGNCRSASDAEETYDKHGTSDACNGDGEGGPWANQVYKITFNGEFSSVPAGFHLDF